MFNKDALRLGNMHHAGEIRGFAELPKHDSNRGELNVLENIWTSRVPSHIPFRDVSSHLSPEKVAEAIQIRRRRTALRTILQAKRWLTRRR